MDSRTVGDGFNGVRSISDTDAVDLGQKGDSAPILLVYLNLLRRRKWVIVTAIGVAIALGLLVTLLSTPVYIATSRIEIQRDSINIVRVEGVEPKTESLDQEFYQTEYGLLQSNTLVERVATDLKLYDDPAFFGMFKVSGANKWFENGKILSSAPPRQKRIEAAGKILLTHLTIEPVRLSRLVDISFSSPDPTFSAKIVNAWGRLFIETTQERRMDTTLYARRYLERSMDQLRGRLNESEQALVRYATQQGIVNLPAGTTATGSTTVERSLAADDLTSLNTALAEAVADRVRAESRLKSGAGASAEIASSPLIGGLRQRRAELAGDYAKLIVQFQPQYPAAVALSDQIRTLDEAIRREEGRISKSLGDAYQAALSRQQDLERRVVGLKTNVLDLRGRSIQYNIFQRDVDTNRQLYDALLQRYKEIGVAGGVGVNNISIVDPGRVPVAPSSPRVFLNLLIALIVGAIVGIIIAVAREHLDDALSSPNQTKSELGLPALGAVPEVGDGLALEALQDRKSDASEAYLATQSALALATHHGFPKTLLVTSSAPQEGKSTSAYALALTLTRIGRQVALVDGDMRSPSVHHLIGVKNLKGLSTFLAGDDDFADLVQRTAIDGLGAITAGPQPPNAAELLSGDRFELLMERLLTQYDHVIIDGPPVMGLADVPLIASRAEGAVFVVRAHKTRVSSARVALGRLADSNVRVFGAILTHYDAKRSYYGYGYDYGMSYGYGKNGESTT
jgi:succinoglycan biosynthesis transport protein ExoP